MNGLNIFLAGVLTLLVIKRLQLYNSDANMQHGHKCICGNVWFHASDMKGNKNAHTCPICGHLQWRIMNNMELSQYQNSSRMVH